MQVILCLVVDENNPDGARKSDLQGVGPERSKLMLQSQSLSSEFSFPSDDDEEEKEEEDNDDDDDKLLPGWFWGIYQNVPFGSSEFKLVGGKYTTVK